MAIRIIVDVLDHANTEPIAKLLLVSLADNADETTRECWPSVEFMARRLNRSESQTRRILQQLRREGFIEIISRKGTSNTYRILDVANPTPSTDDTPPLPQLCDPTPVIAMTGEPSANRQRTDNSTSTGDAIASPSLELPGFDTPFADEDPSPTSGAIDTGDADTPQPPAAPFEILSQVGGILGFNPTRFPEPIKGQQAGIVKRLLKQGETPASILSMARFTKSFTWLKNPEMKAVADRRSQWYAAGCPDGAPPKYNPDEPWLPGREHARDGIFLDDDGRPHSVGEL